MLFLKKSLLFSRGVSRIFKNVVARGPNESRRPHQKMAVASKHKIQLQRN